MSESTYSDRYQEIAKLTEEAIDALIKSRGESYALGYFMQKYIFIVASSDALCKQEVAWLKNTLEQHKS
jgi:hypothetical protein